MKELDDQEMAPCDLWDCSLNTDLKNVGQTFTNNGEVQLTPTATI